MSSESENKRINLTQLEELQLANMDPFKPRLERQVVTNLISELKRCYEKIDKMDEAVLSARELLMSYFDAVTLSDDEAAQEILDVVKELRKASE